MKKKLVVAATAGVLTLAASQAFALENLFNGSFAVRGANANYHTGGGTGYLIAPAWALGAAGIANGEINGNTGAILNAAGVKTRWGANDSGTTKNYVEQRARIFYTAKANDNLKLVTGFEIDSTWGKSSYVVGRSNDGGALGSDTVNLESKWVYLDFNCPITGANVKAGIQPLNDSYKNIFVGGGADAAGLQISKAFGPANLGFGWFRLDDHNGAAGTTFTNGKQTRDLLMLDGKFNVNKDIKFGASYYFLNSDNMQQTAAQSLGGANFAVAGSKQDYNVHMIGANGAATFGPATIDGFILYQFGTVDTFGADPSATAAAAPNTSLYSHEHVNSIAANVSAKVAAGPGAAKINALYVNGGGNAFVNVNNSTSAAFSENVMGAALGNSLILFRNSQYTTNDQYLIYESSFLGQGVIAASAGYDAKISDKAFANVYGAVAWTAKNVVGGSKYIGTEANVEVGYKLFDNLTASVQGAYAILGGYYEKAGRFGDDGRPTDPANPYVARVVLNYVF